MEAPEKIAEKMDELRQEAEYECNRMGPHDICFGCRDGQTYADAATTIRSLLAEVEELKVRDIVSRNPGIDIDDVRHSRAAALSTKEET